jgi:hypothetical protein
MDDLLAWLHNILHQRKFLAVEACHGGEGRWHQPNAEAAPGRIEDERGDIVTYDEGSPSDWEAEHIAANDPASVLADVEATRKLLALHGATSPTVCDLCSSDWHTHAMPCLTVRLLAVRYASWPGYREEWKP